jgi:hypothetical protein
MAKKEELISNNTSKKRKYKKHFVLYNNGGVISATTPKDWARANQHLFKSYDFSDSKNTPIVELIEDVLTNLGFHDINNNEVVIYYQYNSI